MKIRIDSIAFQEFLDAIEWYESQSKGLGKRLKKNINDQIKLIKQFPKWFPIEEGDIYKAYTLKFPYKILYSIEDDGNTIVIFAFAHLHRKPWYWKRQLNN